MGNAAALSRAPGEPYGRGYESHVTEPDFLLFANDAELLAMLGGVLILLAVAAMRMDRRRIKRRDIDRVGWVPWTGLFVMLAVLGGGMLALALPVVIAG